jgi:uncharacterized membrane protein
LVLIRKKFAAAVGLDKLMVLGTVFVAAPLAAFGAEHFTAAGAISQGVPSWMPWHLFWTYFVAIALLAAALSLDLLKYVRWSAPLLAVMFFIFVLTIHLPNVIAHPHDRIRWAVMLRDLAFAAGALAFAGATLEKDATGITPQKTAQTSKVFLFLGRILFAVPLIFFGIEHFLHPEFAPGVPLPKLMPAWVPIPYLWANLVGAVLAVSGVTLILNRRPRLSATFVGLAMTALTILLYMPILCMDKGPAQMIEGVNYVADTLLFGGTALLLAMAMPPDPDIE